MGEYRTSTELEDIWKYQTEVTELESTIIELRHTLEGFSSPLDEEERVRRWQWNSIRVTRRNQKGKENEGS